MDTISVIIPCYNSQHSIAQVVDDIRSVLKDHFDYQIILADDCSSDGVWQEIQKLCSNDRKIIGISLARNFGQQGARMAAINYVTGDYVLFTDDDGQHPAGGILPMVDKLQEGYDIVFAEFRRQKKTLFRKLGSEFARKTSEWLIGKPKGIHTSSFFIARRFVVDTLKQYQSPFPYLMGYFMSITRNITTVELQHRARVYGTSGYSLKKLVLLWLNGFTGFSIVPLRAADILGVAMTAIGFFGGVVMAVRRILNPAMPAGYTSIIVTLLICSGMIMLMLGLTGEYIGRIFLTVNRLPQYVVRDSANVPQQSEHKT